MVVVIFFLSGAVQGLATDIDSVYINSVEPDEIIEILFERQGQGKVVAWEGIDNDLVQDTTFDTISPYVNDIIIVDLDSDGYMETVIGGSWAPPEYDENGIIQIFANESGTLEMVQTMVHPIVQGGSVQSLAVGDLDNDQGLDLEILSGTDGREATVWKKIEGEYKPIHNITLAGFCDALAVGDIDNDNEVELVISCGYGWTGVMVFEFQIDTWINTATFTNFDISGGEIHHIEVNDVDNDDDNEIVVSYDNEPIRVLEYSGSSLSEAWASPFAPGGGYTFVTGDATNDGLVDIVVADQANDLIYMFETVEDVITNTFNISQANMAFDGDGMALGDVDNDNLNEFAVGGTWNFYVFRNDSLIFEKLQGALYTGAMAIGNFDNDVIPSVTPTTSTPTTPTTTSTTGGSPIPLEWLVVGISVPAVLIIVAVIIKWRRSRT